MTSSPAEAPPLSGREDFPNVGTREAVCAAANAEGTQLPVVNGRVAGRHGGRSQREIKGSRIKAYWNANGVDRLGFSRRRWAHLSTAVHQDPLPAPLPGQMEDVWPDSCPPEGRRVAQPTVLVVRL